MTNILTPTAKQKFFDNNGRPLVGGKLFTYGAGGVIKTNTFVGSAGGLNANPIILDYRGECDLWLPPNIGYKLTLAPANDTDPPTAPIWTVDNIFAQQFITLYGGVDGGAVNAYTLTFTAPYSGYVDGTVIYWVPLNNNTGASTLNVNGLGAVSIVQQDGSALQPGQIINNQMAQVVYLSGKFRLLSATNSTFGATLSTSLTGMTLGTFPNVTYDVIGSRVTIYVGAFGQQTGVSNTTGMQMPGLPAAIANGVQPQARPVLLVDNGAVIGGWASISGATITFGTGINNNVAGFTAAGNKGLAAGFSFSYLNR